MVAWIIASLPMWAAGIFTALMMVVGTICELKKAVADGTPSQIEAEAAILTLLGLLVVSTTCLSLAAWMVS